MVTCPMAQSPALASVAPQKTKACWGLTSDFLDKNMRVSKQLQAALPGQPEVCPRQLLVLQGW